jgi:phosphoglycerate-specific signal transduction histidine kinase
MTYTKVRANDSQELADKFSSIEQMIEFVEDELNAVRSYAERNSYSDASYAMIHLRSAVDALQYKLNKLEDRDE